MISVYSNVRIVALRAPLCIPQAIAFPESRAAYESRRQARRAKRAILAVGIAQIVLGTAAFLTLKIQLGELHGLTTVATLWLIGAGIIALCSSFCTLRKLMAISGSATSNSFKNKQFSVFILYIYQGIVLTGVLLNSAAAINGIDSYSQGSSSSKRTSLRSWNRDVSAFISGVVLSISETVIAVAIQRTSIGFYVTKRNLERERLKQAAAEENAAHHEEQPTVQQEAAQLLPQTLTVIHGHDLPPRYSSVGLPTTDNLRVAQSTIRPTEGEGAEGQDRPPQYSYLGDPCHSPPPPFTSRRNSITLQTLPPSYSESLGFFPRLD